jgi:hypothetical protein
MGHGPPRLAKWFLPDQVAALPKHLWLLAQVAGPALMALNTVPRDAVVYNY